uniref:Uncharacterized protein n=1 Tax=Mus musculus TaxID=10090 RepID=Q3U283_MOUSE|nr:unnamed protein product [Mus musculus]
MVLKPSAGHPLSKVPLGASGSQVSHPTLTSHGLFVRTGSPSPHSLVNISLGRFLPSVQGRLAVSFGEMNEEIQVQGSLEFEGPKDHGLSVFLTVVSPWLYYAFLCAQPTQTTSMEFFLLKLRKRVPL